MAKRVRGKQHPDGAIRLALWGVLALVLTIAYLDRHPIQLDSEETLEAGKQVVLEETQSDVLVVVNYSAMPEAASFDAMDFSLAWLNTFQQEIGPVTLRDAAHINPDTELSDYQVVVLTRSASNMEVWKPKLETFVKTGGVLVLEMPDGALRETFSADGEGGLREPQHISAIQGMSEDYVEALKRVPLHTRVVGSKSALEGAEALMHIDGVPVIYRKQLGQGWAITFDFDYGMLLTSLQQGRPPGSDFRLRSLRGREAVEPADMVISDLLVESPVPLADALERFVIYGVLDPSHPMVALWPFPSDAEQGAPQQGALVLTHDEAGLGAAADWMAAFVNERYGGSATYFVRVGGAMDAASVAALEGHSTDVGLEWNRETSAEEGVFRRLGLWTIEPFEAQLTLVEQAEALGALQASGRPLISARLRDHLWDRDWTLPFQALSAAGVMADATYAPPPGVAGYTFGTGLPFMPLDRTGLAFGLMEFPSVLVAQGAPEEREQLAAMLERSKARDHQALGLSVSPRAFVERPSAELYETWRAFYRLAAEEHSHWVTSVSQMLRLQTARRDSELRSLLSAVEVDGHDQLRLRVEVLALEGHMFCSVPRMIGERALLSAGRRPLSQAEGEDAAVTPLQGHDVDLMGYERTLLPLDKGYNVIEVTYE